jgi:hypothetical protein
MRTKCPDFDSIYQQGESATHPLARLVMRLPLSLVVALKDSDPLWAEAHVESYAAVTRPDAPSGASSYGF